MNAEREIISIVWYPHRPDWYEVIYADGDFERVPGTQADAKGAAEMLGLGPPQQDSGRTQWESKEQ